ncbi:carbon storage regulator CsrA [Microbulbifer sp. JMSA008]|uniref:carbon storage regulator CsrA n=1 Tax=Microbulbifer sp. JMSA008 TaxID=3243373 RepID=UPI00403992E6
MLILKRRIGENLRIGADVSVTVLEVKANQVKIGISAPRSLPIHREEIYVRIKKQLKAKA